MFLLCSNKYMAWKVGPSGDLATSAFAKTVAARSNKVKGSAVASGFYTWWTGETGRGPVRRTWRKRLLVLRDAHSSAASASFHLLCCKCKALLSSNCVLAAIGPVAATDVCLVCMHLQTSTLTSTATSRLMPAPGTQQHL